MAHQTPASIDLSPSSPAQGSGRIAGSAIVVSGLSLVVSGLSFMLQAFRSGGGIGLPLAMIFAGALVCAVGGFVAGRN